MNRGAVIPGEGDEAMEVTGQCKANTNLACTGCNGCQVGSGDEVPEVRGAVKDVLHDIAVLEEELSQ